jgi:REP element-mobilizing transposase RayT
MNAYTQILYQIIFGTRCRRKVLIKENRDELFKYISGLLAAKQCHLYRINGVEDHLHIVTHIHPTIALSNLIKDIKLASTDYIKRRNLFPSFEGWQGGYGAFTYSIDAKDNLINYVKNQERHHRKISYRSELVDLLTKYNVDFELKYLQ